MWTCCIRVFSTCIFIVFCCGFLNILLFFSYISFYCFLIFVNLFEVVTVSLFFSYKSVIMGKFSEYLIQFLLYILSSSKRLGQVCCYLLNRPILKLLIITTQSFVRSYYALLYIPLNMSQYLHYPTLSNCSVWLITRIINGGR